MLHMFTEDITAPRALPIRLKASAPFPGFIVLIPTPLTTWPPAPLDVAVHRWFSPPAAYCHTLASTEDRHGGDIQHNFHSVNPAFYSLHLRHQLD